MDWNRVFLTRAHQQEHDDRRWCVVAVDCDAIFCVLCADDILGSAAEFVVRKKHLLNEFLSLLIEGRSSRGRRLQQHAGRLIDLLKLEDATIVSRIVLTLVGLTRNDDAQLAVMSMEGAVQLLQLLDRDVVTNNTLSNVIQLVSQSDDQAGCSAFLQLINQLLQRKQTVANCLATTNGGELVRFLEAAIGSVLNDETKNLVVAIVTRLVAELGWISSLHPLAMKVPREILRTLHLTQHAELKITAFTLLRLMVANSLLLKMLFDVNIEGATFPLVIKRHLLNARDKQARLLCIQCVEDVLRSDLTSSRKSEYAGSLLQNDLATFLFELLGTADEVLLESSLRCCILLTDVAAFFRGCHAIFGIQAIVRSVDISLAFSNAQPTILALELMNNVFERHTLGSPLVCNALSVVEIFDILKKGLKNPAEEISLHAAEALASFLKKQHLLNPIPFETIGDLIKICVDWMKQLLLVTLNRRQKSLLQRQTVHIQRTVRVTLKLVASALLLCLECADEPISIVETYDVPAINDNAVCSIALTELKQILLSSLEEVFVPLILSHSSFLNCANIFQHFFTCLSTDFRLKGTTEDGNRFAQKLASSDFLRLTLDYHAQLEGLTAERADVVLRSRNVFLESVIYRLIAIDHSLITSTNAPASSFWSSSTNSTQSNEDTPGLQELVREGLANIKSLPLKNIQADLDSIDYLDHRQSQSVKTTFLATCYYSRLYGNSIFHASILLPALTNHLLTKQTASNGFDEKFIIFLMAVCSYECIETEDDRTANIISNCREAIQILVKHIHGMKDPASVYTHHPLLLKWIFSLDDVADSIGVCMFRQCLVRSLCDAAKDPSSPSDLGTEVMLEVANSNERFADMFTVRLADNDDPVLAAKIFQLLELFLERECSDNLSRCLLVRVPKILSYVMTPNYHQQLDSIKAVDLLLRLLCHCMRFKEDNRYLATSDNDPSILKQLDKTTQWLHKKKYWKTLPRALQCLNLLLSRFTFSNDTRGAAILLTSTKLLPTLAAIVSMENCETETLSEAFVILSLLCHHQRKTRIQVSDPVSISFLRLRNAMFSSEKHVVLGSLQILNSQLTSAATTNPPCVRLNSVSYGESHTLRFEDLTVITATLLNLLIKEQSNSDIRNAVLSCLLDVFSFTQANHGHLISELADDPWTALAIEKLVNQHATINDFMFIAKVLKHVKKVSDGASSIWMETFEHLLNFFEDAKDCPKFYNMSFKDVEVKILHNLADIIGEQINCAAMAGRIKRRLQTVSESDVSSQSQPESQQYG